MQAAFISMSEQEQVLFLGLSSSGRVSYMKMPEGDRKKFSSMANTHNQQELELYLKLNTESRKVFTAMMRDEMRRFQRETETFALSETIQYISMTPKGRKVYQEMDMGAQTQFRALKMGSLNEQDVYLQASDKLRMRYLRMSAEAKRHFRNMMAEGKLDNVEHRFVYISLNMSERESAEFMSIAERAEFLDMTPEERHKKFVLDDTQKMVARLGMNTAPSVRFEALEQLDRMSGIKNKADREIMVETRVIESLKSLVAHGGKTSREAFNVMKNFVRYTPAHVSQELLTSFAEYSTTAKNRLPMIEVGITQPLIETIRLHLDSMAQVPVRPSYFCGKKQIVFQEFLKSSRVDVDVDTTSGIFNMMS